MNKIKHNAIKTALASLLLAGGIGTAQAAQDITAAEIEQINAQLAPVVNPQANAEKVGSAPEDPAAAVGTRFTYQGTLRLSGDRAQGTYDFRFRLYNVLGGGTQLGSTLAKNDLPVTDGLFSTELDFGQAPIDGDDIFLQIEVRDGASTGAYTILSPRQRINATPYAVRALAGGDGGGSSPWNVSGTVVSYTGGNVGIGTASPGTRLTVKSSNDQTAVFDTGNNGYISILEEGSPRGYIGSFQSGTNAIDADFEIGTGAPNSSGRMHIVTQATPRITVEPDGQVGVGTLSPLARLHVEAPAGEDPLRVRINGDTQLVVKANGYVGIGPSNPAAPLHMRSDQAETMRIGGGNQAHVSFWENNNFRGYAGSTQTGTGNFMDADFEIGTPAANSTGRMHIVTQQTPRITVAANGNVGIPGESSTAQLTVSAENNEASLRVRNVFTDRLVVKGNGNTRVFGDLEQPANKGGALKAAVHIYDCGGTAGNNQSVTRQFNGVNSAAITATDNGTGKCIIDFPFNINTRFWSVNALHGTAAVDVSAWCDVASTNDKLHCVRFITSNPDYPMDGRIIVLVY